CRPPGPGPGSRPLVGWLRPGRTRALRRLPRLPGPRRPASALGRSGGTRCLVIQARAQGSGNNSPHRHRDHRRYPRLKETGAMTESFRRIVTGFNAQGKSVIVKDTRMPSGLFGGAEFWRTHSSPASLVADSDADTRPGRLEPPAGGTLFRFFEIPPENPGVS